MLDTPRDKRIKNFIANRQLDLTIVLENVHDPHNIGAVMRTCDAVGIHEIYALYTKNSRNAEHEYVGIKAARGTRKWVKCHFYTDLDECFSVIENKYNRILGTHLSSEAKSIYEVDFTESTAIVLGNEHEGLTDKALARCHGNILIPIVGMVQSLNVSVAAAVTMYEAHRQRKLSGMYDRPFDFFNHTHKEMYSEAVGLTYTRVLESTPEVIEQLIQQKGPIIYSDSDKL